MTTREEMERFIAGQRAMVGGGIVKAEIEAKVDIQITGVTLNRLHLGPKDVLVMTMPEGAAGDDTIATERMCVALREMMERIGSPWGGVFLILPAGQGAASVEQLEAREWRRRCLAIVRGLRREGRASSIPGIENETDRAEIDAALALL